MVKILKGVGDAALKFVIIGIIVPFALDYFNPLISKYVTLPSSYDRWLAFLVFGVFFAVTGFFQNAYSKGDYPWLFGKIGGGAVAIAFYSYLLLYLPSSAGAGAGTIQATGLVELIYLAMGLSYLYLIFDFYDARRTKRTILQNVQPKQPAVS